MRGTRAAVAALAGLVLVALAALPSYGEVVPVSKGTHTFRTLDAKVPVVDGPSDDHQATIDTRLYLPDNATAKTPQPAVLITHGFGLTKLAGEVVSHATFLARHGYVVLTYTAQGFGESTGCVTLQSRSYDVKDAKQLISKLLTRPEVKKDAKGPVVGMTGGSYGGGIQANVAENDPRIRAINPGRTWNHLAYSLDPNNYVAPGDPTGFTHELNTQGVFKQEWTSLFFASGNGNPVGGVPPTGTPAGTCPQEKLGEADVPGLVCPGFHFPVCQTFATVTATGNAQQADRDLLADSSATTQINQLRVPTLLFQGQADTLFNVNDALATYTALQRRGVPVYMVWNSGGHGGYDSLPGECDVYGRGTGGTDYRGLDSCYLSLRTLRFFDRFLKGSGDPGPGFTWFQDWVPYKGSGPTTQYGVAGQFPPGRTLTYTLSGSGDLVRGAATAASVSIVNPAGGVPPAYSETSNFTGPDSSPRVPLPPTEMPGQHADFTSEPFTEPVNAVGVPELKVRLSHVAPTDLVVFAKAYDVAPDGGAELIKRLVAPARIPSAALGQPVRIKLLGFAHRFDKGHRLRLTLATTDATSYNNKVPDVITIATGAGSALTLDVAAEPLLLHPNDPAPPKNRGKDVLAATGLTVVVPILALVLLGGALALYRRRGVEDLDGDVVPDPLDDGGR
jgi:ABC-2 type transport system ATP-binding protein